jgi:hypothetical protein
VTGERRFGANGETLSAWSDDGATGSSSGLNVVPIGGGEGVVNIAPSKAGASDATWTADGRAVVMLADGAIYRWDGRHTAKVRDLTATLKRQYGLGIVGLSESGVFLSNDAQGVTFLPFDTSPSRGTDGILTAVVP